MSFWNDVRVNAQAAAREVGKQANRAGQWAKLKARMAALNRTLSTKYEWVGRLTYRDRIRGTSGSADGLMDEIAKLRAQRDDLAQQIAQLTGASAVEADDDLTPPSDPDAS